MDKIELSLKEKKDIEMLNKKYPERDIVEVAYDKDGKLFACAARDIPPPTYFDPSILNDIPCYGI